MEILTAIVLMVAGVLQIVLFFKIWGMTNDVEKLTERFCTQESSKLLSPFFFIAKYKVLGQPQKAIDLLLKRLDAKQDELLLSVYNSQVSYEAAEAEWKEALEYCEKFLQKLGSNVPDGYKNFSFLTFKTDYEDLRRL